MTNVNTNEPTLNDLAEELVALLGIPSDKREAAVVLVQKYINSIYLSGSFDVLESLLGVEDDADLRENIELCMGLTSAVLQAIDRTI